MNCPGSVELLKTLNLPSSDEPDYRTLGTAAHAVACECLQKGLDAWEVMGQKYGKHEADDDLINAVQFYLDEVRSLITPASKLYFEFQIDNPDFHPQFYGTVDCGVITGTTLYVRDYKHGEGIAVDVEWNPQIMYYAYGLLRHHPDVTEVNLGIVQPRGFHPDGPVRTWVTSADSIRAWASETLKPAMDRTELDHSLDAGPWCRFCPAKLVCPLMTSLFGAACTADPQVVVNLSDASLGRSYQYVQAVKFYLKAMEDETFRRLNGGGEVPGTKLVMKKANRVWKEGFNDVFAGIKEAWTVPEFKSPAEMEKIGAEAKALVRQWAYTPQTGYTVALETDKRAGVKVQPAQEAFAHAPGVNE